MNTATAILLACLSLASTPASVHAYCWAAGQNPGFSGPPIVQQVAIDTVRVNWGHVVTMRKCADNFVVKFWPRTAPNDYEVSDLAPQDADFIEVKVIPKIYYQFQAVAREDKGVIGGVDWNKSPTVDFKTSSLGPKRVTDADSPPPIAAPGEDGASAQANGLERAAPEQVVYPDEFEPTRVMGMSVEVFAGMVVIVLIVTLIVVGVIYKCVAGGKKNADDDDDDDDDDDEDDSDVEKGGGGADSDSDDEDAEKKDLAKSAK